MKSVLLEALQSQDLHPVLVDIGASGRPPAIWDALAPQAIYVGFDPALSSSSSTHAQSYFQFHLLNKAITHEVQARRTPFYRTALPCCSSALRPLAEDLSKYSFAHYFTVVAEENIPCTPLQTELGLLGLDHIHWLKLDTQGQDLRLYVGLPEQLQKSILALDIEPGLINAYQNEDLFVDCHRHLVKDGFWLSRLETHGVARIDVATRQWLAERHAVCSGPILEQRLRPSPGWCNACYLREISWLEDHHLPSDAYQLLAIFAFLNDQSGYCLDVLLRHDRHFGEDAWSARFKEQVIAKLCPTQRRVLPALGRFAAKLCHPLSALIGSCLASPHAHESSYARS